MDLDKLRRAVDLFDLATKAGGRFRNNGHTSGRSHCPLHGGKNAGAFAITTDGDGVQHWRCYTDCQDGGDAIDFVRRWKGLDFIEAVKLLDMEYHIGLGDLHSQADIKAEKERREQIDLLTIAAGWFASQLWSEAGSQALAYARSRGFTDETIKGAGFGFSTTDTGLAQHFAAKRLNIGPAKNLGLIRSDGVDFTGNANGKEASPEGWLIYPHYEGERVHYFSSRALSPVDPTDKSRNLPGHRQLYRCELPGHYDEVVLVEGPADARSLWQLGFSSWALCGLWGEMPERDLNALKNKKNVWFAPDTDEAGETALSKVNSKPARMASTIGPMLMIPPRIPDGKDFNAWLQAGATAEKIKEHLSAARTWIDIRMNYADKCHPSEEEDRNREIGKLFCMIPEISRTKYFNLASDILGWTRSDINKLIQDASGQRDGQILSSIKDGKLCFLGKPVGNFQARISHELTMDDGQDRPTVRYTIVGKLASGEPLEPIDVEAEEFEGLKWIPKHWGARAIQFVRKSESYEITRGIQEISLKDMKRERVYTYTGWTTIEDERSFLSPTGRITAEGLDATTRVELTVQGSNNLRLYGLPDVSNLDQEQAARASLEFLEVGNPLVTAPLWAAMYAAPLTCISPLYAVLWVYGPTQSGKSTISHLALTHFGAGFIDGTKYHAPIDWISTAATLEGAMFMTKDIPLIIDDFAPQMTSKAEASDMHKRAHYVVRSVGNRSSRGRSRADLTLRAVRIPRGMVISTAEQPLIGQSTVGRMLYIPVAHGDVIPMDKTQPPRLLNAAQEKGRQGLYAQAMAGFIQYLARDWERISEQFPLSVEAASAVVRQQKPDLQNRLPDYYGLLAAAQELAITYYMREVRAITPSQAKTLTDRNKDAILQLICQQAEKIAEESPVKKVFEAISSLLERQLVYLAPSTKAVSYHPPDRAELIGWFNPEKKNVIYLKTDLILIHSKDFWRSLDQNLDIAPDALRRQIAQIPGLLLEKDDAQFEASKYVAGQTRRVLVLDLDIIFKLYGLVIGNEASEPLKEYNPGSEKIPF